jgi:hypothetical protein
MFNLLAHHDHEGQRNRVFWADIFARGAVGAAFGELQDCFAVNGS